jgi:hypothetical protein
VSAWLAGRYASDRSGECEVQQARSNPIDFIIQKAKAYVENEKLLWKNQ